MSIHLYAIRGKIPLEWAFGERDSNLSLVMNIGQGASFAGPQLPPYWSHGVTVKSQQDEVNEGTQGGAS